MSLRNKVITFAITLGTLAVIGCGAIAYYLTNRDMVKLEIHS